MSCIKRFIENVMELWEEGMTVEEIAESLRVDLETIENVVDEYIGILE
jgi:orotate phosphoribosyltransferase-like protein